MLKRLSFVALISVIALSSAFAAQVGSWTFEGDCNDVSGNGNHGTLVGVGTGQFVFDGQRASKVLKLDGNAWVEVANESNFDFTNQFTVTAWVKADGEQISWASLVSKFGAWEILEHSSNMYTDGSVYIGGVQKLATNWYAPFAFDGNWHFVALTYNGSQIVMYVDNLLPAEATVAATGNLDLNDNPVRIGGNGTNNFNGYIDDVKIYDNGMSASEIEQLRKMNIMLGFWQFEDNFNDTSGSGNNGAPAGIGTASFVYDSGRNGKVLNLDGNAWIQIANEANFDFTNQFTVTAWVKANGAQVNWASLVSKFGAWEILKHSSANYTDGSVYIGGVQKLAISWYAPFAFDGDWHFVALTYDNSKVKMYVDGQLPPDANVAATGNLNLNDNPVRIGGNITQNFKGYMDDVRIYNYALSKTTLDAVSMDTQLTPPNSLVAQFKLEGDANDTSGLGNHGTVLNPSGSDFAYDFQRGKQVLVLDGYNSVSVANPLNFNFPDGVTVTGWLKVDGTGLSSAGWTEIVGKWGAWGLKQHSTEHWLGSYIFQYPVLASDMYVLNGAGATSEGEDWAVGTWAAPANAPDPFDGNWHFFATTYDNYTIKVFLDYTVVSTFRSGGFMPINTNPLRLGSSGDPQHNLVGSLSDISVYNYALPESEVFQNVCTVAKYDIGSRDCTIDSNDLAVFVSQWLQVGSGLSADFDGNKSVNLADFSEFALKWLQTD